MNTMKTKSVPDFQYLEFSGNVACPFCCTHLIAEPPNSLPTEDNFEKFDEIYSKDTPEGGEGCNHVGFWRTSEQPNVNETWRHEIFLVAEAINKELKDGEDGYYWQETLDYHIGDEGDANLGHIASIILPNFHVALCRQFSYNKKSLNNRYLNYVAIILKRKNLS